MEHYDAIANGCQKTCTLFVLGKVHLDAPPLSLSLLLLISNIYLKPSFSLFCVFILVFLFPYSLRQYRGRRRRRCSIPPPSSLLYQLIPLPSSLLCFFILFCIPFIERTRTQEIKFKKKLVQYWLFFHSILFQFFIDLCCDVSTATHKYTGDSLKKKKNPICSTWKMGEKKVGVASAALHHVFSAMKHLAAVLVQSLNRWRLNYSNFHLLFFCVETNVCVILYCVRRNWLVK